MPLLASAERPDATQVHSIVTKSCELLPKRFSTYKRAAGGRLCRKTCRFWFRAAAGIHRTREKSILGVPTALLDNELNLKTV